MATGYGAVMPDDDQTQEAPAGGPATTELGVEPAVTDALAYSDHTTSMPVLEYRPAPRRWWIIALVLAAAGAVAAVTFLLGRTTARQEPATAAVPPDSSSAVATPSAAVAASAPPAVAAPSPAPVIVAPPVAAVPAPTAAPAPTPTTSVPPLATPQARIAEPIICSLHNQYPQMQPVDLALSLNDKGIYTSYDEARLVVDLVLADGCHGI